MKIIIISLLSLIITCSTSLHLKLTPEEYKALKIATKGNDPYLVQNALPLWSITNVQSDKTIHLKMDNKGLLFPKKYSHGKPKPSDIIDVEPTFKKGFLPSSKNKFSKSGFVSRRNDLLFRPFDSSLGFKITNLLPPIYRAEVLRLSPLSKRYQILSRMSNNIRRKRSADPVPQATVIVDEVEEEEEPVRYAEELSFGLSTLGGLVGGSIGGYLDRVNFETTKLINRLESLGLLSITQFDNFLDQQETNLNGSNGDDLLGAPFNITETVIKT